MAHEGLIEDRSAVALANRVLKTAVGKISQSSEFTTCCFWVSHFGAPPRVIQLIKQIAESDAQSLKFVAVLALSALERPLSSSVESVLRAEMSRKESGPKAAAAFALLHALGTADDDAVSVVRQCLCSRDKDRRLHALAMLRCLPEVMRVLAPEVVRIANSSEGLTHQHTLVIQSLGHLAASNHDARAAIARAMSSPKVEIVDAALGAMEQADTMPMEFITAIKKCLRDSRPSLVVACVLGLARLTHLAPFRDELINCISKHHSRAYVEALAASLAKTGPGVVTTLSELFTSRDDVTVGTVTGAAIQMSGADGIIELLDYINRSKNDFALHLMLGAAREMGPRLAHAVSAMADLLNSTNDLDVAEALVAAIMTSGPGAVDAIPSLLNCMATRRDQVANYAERIIRIQGPAALPQLRSWIADASEDKIARVIHLLDDLDAGKNSRYRQLAGIPADKVRLFHDTAEQLAKASPQTMADLAKSTSADVPINEAALRSVLSRLEKQLGVKLLRGKSSVGYVLTPRGRDLLPEARVRVAASDI